MSSVLRRPLLAVGFLSLVVLGSLSVSGVAAAHVTAAHHARNATMIRPGGTLRGAKGNSAIDLSLNWSGYAVTSATQFNFVHTEFIQPSITCKGQKYTDQSQWVGLDGFNSNTVEQDGTNAYCGGPDHMTPQYRAWYEMFPAVSVNVFAVHPGDVIDAQVTFSHGMFTTTITDVTLGKTSGTTAACSAVPALVGRVDRGTPRVLWRQGVRQGCPRQARSLHPGHVQRRDGRSRRLAGHGDQRQQLHSHPDQHVHPRDA